MSYICKIATLDEMNEKWDYEINKANYDMIEKISKDQNGVIRRLFPIIPKVKK